MADADDAPAPDSKHVYVVHSQFGDHQVGDHLTDVPADQMHRVVRKLREQSAEKPTEKPALEAPAPQEG